VTGGASGIGAECARRFVAEGATVVLGDRDADKLAAMADELGDACVTEVMDVTRPSDVARLVDRARDAFGGLDLAVNAAGIGTFAPVHEHPVDQWESVVDVCLKGTFLAVREESRALLATGRGGSIVNVASINAIVPAEGMAAYCSAKAAVVMLTRCSAMELGPHGVRVNAIGPGYVETPLTEFARQFPAVHDGYLASIPLGRAGQPRDIADAAVFLSSSEASWISGTTLYVDGASANKAYPSSPGSSPGADHTAPRCAVSSAASTSRRRSSPGTMRRSAVAPTTGTFTDSRPSMTRVHPAASPRIVMVASPNSRSGSASAPNVRVPEPSEGCTTTVCDQVSRRAPSSLLAIGSSCPVYSYRR
jgi:NAD(P)-dependent dehydrogenase (short-subunit alcohol dehydrogenase family)